MNRVAPLAALLLAACLQRPDPVGRFCDPISPCPDGLFCSAEGRCDPAPPASTDASTAFADASPILDAGSALDAGRTDAGPPPDAAIPDSGPPDGGVAPDVGYPRVTRIADLSTGRGDHSATLLADGRVLIAGGYGAAGALASAEIYDPSTRSFASTGTMRYPRAEHTATLLSDGTVLIAGGTAGHPVDGVVLPAERYTPSSGSWSAAGSLSFGRWDARAALTNGGQVVLTGGYPNCSAVERYDPVANSWTTLGPLATWRYAHAAVRLADGRVFVVGGASSGYTPTSEYWDTAAGAWRYGASMAIGRASFASMLATGVGLVITGGVDTDIQQIYRSVEILDPMGAWRLAAPMAEERRDHAIAQLLDGRIWVAGGDGPAGSLATSELYDPALDRWNAGPPIGAPRRGMTATRVAGGAVLLAGGSGASAWAELLEP